MSHLSRCNEEPPFKSAPVLIAHLQFQTLGMLTNVGNMDTPPYTKPKPVTRI